MKELVEHKLQINKNKIRVLDIKNKESVFMYLHPREIEINQEKIELKMLENFIHYHGINSCEKKLTNLITHFSKFFIRMDEFVTNCRETNK